MEAVDEAIELWRPPTLLVFCSLRASQLICLSVIFLQNNLFKFKNGTQKNTKTNHYILLTNVSFKRCIIPSSNRVLLGGGKSSSQTSTLQTLDSFIQVICAIN